MRDHFLLDPDVIFLNHGSFGACPRPVFEAYQQWQRTLERQPVAFFQRRYDDALRHARERLAATIGTHADNLVFVPNATTGINAVARSLDLRRGDEILTTTHEYGALQKLWRFVCQRTDAEIVAQPLPPTIVSDDALVEAIWSGVTPYTKVLFLSHITSSTALILPVAELCRRAREAGILTVIDGAHVPGQLPLNLAAMGADYYSGNCHKWLCAPKGAGFLYANPAQHAQVQPPVISWGWEPDASFADKFAWQGTRDIAAYLSVPDALDFLEAHDWDAQRERCHAMAVDIAYRLCEITGTPPLAMPRFVGQMVAVPLPPTFTAEDAIALKAYLLDEHRIEVPVTTLMTETGERHFLRVSVQAYNTPDDLDALLTALHAYLHPQATNQTPTNP